LKKTSSIRENGIKKDKWFIYLTFALAVLLMAGSGCGILMENTYALESASWRIQGIAQDVVDLFIIAPALIVSGIFTFHKKRIFVYIFGGTLLFIAYSYFFYCFAVHFNYLFLIYCFTLGLSVYSFIYLIVSLATCEIIKWYNNKVPAKTIGIYLLVIAALFYIMWLSEILPALIHNRAPENIIQNGLLTNPVHVLDISLLLPAFIITAVLLMKKRSAGFLLAPTILVFCILMNINIAALVIAMKLNEITDSLLVSWLMLALALISISLLYIFLKHLNKKNEFQ